MDNEHNRPLLLQERRHRVTEENYRKLVKQTLKGTYVQATMSLLAVLPYCQRRGTQSESRMHKCSVTVQTHLRRDGPVPRRNVDSSVSWKTLRRPRINFVPLSRSRSPYTNLGGVSQDPLHRDQQTFQDVNLKKELSPWNTVRQIHASSSSWCNSF